MIKSPCPFCGAHPEWEKERDAAIYDMQMAQSTLHHAREYQHVLTEKLREYETVITERNAPEVKKLKSLVLDLLRSEV